MPGWSLRRSSARITPARHDDDVWTPGFVSPLPVFGVSLLEEGTDHILEMCRVDREGMPLSDDPPKLFKLHDGQIEEIT